MKKSVASRKDITAFANPSPKHKEYPSWSGGWTAGKITIKVYRHFNINGEPIAYQASCTFIFKGSDTTTNSLVSDRETVTLKAQNTTLQNQLSYVLCDGDEETGSKENKLKVTCKHLLTTD